MDELFYALDGEYIVEVGSERVHLKPGDCVLGPREIPHAWAFAGGSPGRLLISFAPAGKMEAFFNERENRGIKPDAYTTDAAFMREFGMELIGPGVVVEYAAGGRGFAAFDFRGLFWFFTLVSAFGRPPLLVDTPRHSQPRKSLITKEDTPRQFGRRRANSPLGKWICTPTTRGHQP